ncbi:MAG: DUF3592 domain-containing protein [Verrucomicrobia bacterium]|nr:DUF3592 domain-containing protein [Verrucomicrobiota bacterium]
MLALIRKLVGSLTRDGRSGWAFAILCAVISIASGSRWGFNKFRYRDIGQWPSVPVEIDALYSMHGTIPTETRTGRSRIGTFLNTVRYTYRVRGLNYQGDRASPDGDIPPVWTVSVNGVPQTGPEFRAFYKPDQPEISVLFPIPYQGNGLLLTALVAGGVCVLAVALSRLELS